jgi:MoaA/NifB/PqqE/SkfB family radical SAM enzyme
MPPDLLNSLLDQLGAADDRLVVFGGLGDPLSHDDWPAALARARQAGVMGVGLRTTGLLLDEAAIAHLLETPPDVISVALDAACAATYARVHQRDAFAQVTAGLEHLLRARAERRNGLPWLVCELMKTAETMDDIEAFYDRWVNAAGAALVVGPSHHAGQWPDRGVINMAPPTRRPCRRLWARSIVLADGRLAMCDQDYRGLHPVGDLTRQSLAEVWNGPELQRLREEHAGGRWDALPLCGACDEWHR